MRKVDQSDLTPEVDKAEDCLNDAKNCKAYSKEVQWHTVPCEPEIYRVQNQSLLDVDCQAADEVICV